MYEVDITYSYPQFICWDSEIESSLSLPKIEENSDKNYEVMLNNIEVNMHEKYWYSQILDANPDSIIKQALNKLDLNTNDWTFSLLLRRATLSISDVKSVHLKIKRGLKEQFHSWDTSFKKGDKYIWIASNSADYSDTLIYSLVFFSGSVKILFKESDIIIYTSGVDTFINQKQIRLFNQSEKEMTALKQQNLDKLRLNNIKSPFFVFDYSKKYFLHSEYGNVAIEDYDKNA